MHKFETTISIHSDYGVKRKRDTVTEPQPGNLTCFVNVLADILDICVVRLWHIPAWTIPLSRMFVFRQVPAKIPGYQKAPSPSHYYARTTVLTRAATAAGKSSCWWSEVPEASATAVAWTSSGSQLAHRVEPPTHRRRCR